MNFGYIAKILISVEGVTIKGKNGLPSLKPDQNGVHGLFDRM